MISSNIHHYELQMILAHILKKSREYVLAHPEIGLNKAQESKLKKMVARREKHEPMAYILGHKEFYGLDFKVTPDTLIPRPETEMLVEEASDMLRNMLRSKLRNKITVIDVGTGSGNIIITLAKISEQRSMISEQRTVKRKSDKKSIVRYYGSDISDKALRVAMLNAKKHNVDKKIKFLKSNLLDHFLTSSLKAKSYKLSACPFPKSYELKANSLILTANLPYLSKEIYESAMPDVKNYEPKSALYSPKEGLAHYEKLFKQIKDVSLFIDHCSLIVEFSPEQKSKIKILCKKFFPHAGLEFKKDLAGKWRLAIMKI